MAEEQKGTNYVILQQIEIPGTDHAVAYQEIGTAVGGNDDAAINTFLTTGDNGEVYGEGKYRAVPRRSWAPQPREKKRQVSFR